MRAVPSTATGSHPASLPRGAGTTHEQPLAGTGGAVSPAPPEAAARAVVEGRFDLAVLYEEVWGG